MWQQIRYQEKYSCLYSDTKPTANIPEGSILAEVQSDDSIKYYEFLQGNWRALE